MKEKRKNIFNKVYKFYSGFSVVFSSLFLVIIFVARLSGFNGDSCVSDGICIEGDSLNTEYGEITFNKETCLKHNWK